MSWRRSLLFSLLLLLFRSFNSIFANCEPENERNTNTNAESRFRIRANDVVSYFLRSCITIIVYTWTKKKWTFLTKMKHANGIYKVHNAQRIFYVWIKYVRLVSCFQLKRILGKNTSYAKHFLYCQIPADC